MGNQINIVITTTDQNFASTKDQIIRGLGDMDRAGQQAGRGLDSAFAFAKGQFIYDFFKQGASAAVEFGKEAVQAFNEARAAQLGLTSVAQFKGIAGDVTQTLKDLQLVKDGLLSLGEASQTLQPLLARGFSLEQSVNLLKAFADNAAFGKQAGLTFGQAVISQAQGVKQLNNQLSDNGGLTTNLSVILKQRGFELADLDDKQKSAAATLAFYNGLLAESAPNQGNASKVAQEFAGQLGRLEAAQKKFFETTGGVIAQNPELAKGISAITDEITKLAEEAGRSGSGVNELLTGTVNIASEVLQSMANIVQSARLLADTYKELKQSPAGGIVGTLELLNQTVAPVSKALGIDARKEREASLAKETEAAKRWTAEHAKMAAVLAKETAERKHNTEQIEARRAAIVRSQAEEEAVALLTSHSPLSPGQRDRLTFIMKFELDQAGADKALAQARKASEDFAKLEHDALTQVTQLGRELAGDNSMVKTLNEAGTAAEKFGEKFGAVSDDILRRFDQLSKRKFATDFFKSDLESIEKITQLTQRAQQLSSGREFEQAEQQRRAEFAQKQAGYESQIRELQTGRQLDQVEKAAEAVRSIVQSGLVGVELSKAIAQATEGLSVEQLQQGGLRYTRRDALVDIQQSERTAEAFRKAPPEVEQARDFINKAQKEFDLAKLNPSFDQAQGQEILDKTISTVLGRIDPSKLSPDLRNLELDATKRQIEHEVQQRAALQAMVEKFGVSINTFDSASGALKTAIEKGITIDVSVKDDPFGSTRSRLDSVAPGAEILAGGGLSNNY